jgi:hypothetical protein
MTGKQRVLAKLRGEPTDSLLMPITMMFATDPGATVEWFLHS